MSSPRPSKKEPFQKHQNPRTDLALHHCLIHPKSSRSVIVLWADAFELLSRKKNIKKKHVLTSTKIRPDSRPPDSFLNATKKHQNTNLPGRSKNFCILEQPLHYFSRHLVNVIKSVLYIRTPTSKNLGGWSEESCILNKEAPTLVFPSSIKNPLSNETKQQLDFPGLIREDFCTLMQSSTMPLLLTSPRRDPNEWLVSMWTDQVEIHRWCSQLPCTQTCWKGSQTPGIRNPEELYIASSSPPDLSKRNEPSPRQPKIAKLTTTGHLSNIRLLYKK